MDRRHRQQLLIVGLDGISLPLLLLTVIVPLVVIYSWDHFPEPHNPKAFLALILVLQAGMVGIFIAQDLILFFVFFEVVLLPMYFMIGVWGGNERQYASIKFFLYTLFGSALMLLFLALSPSWRKVTFKGVYRSTNLESATSAETGGAKVTHLAQLFAGMFLGLRDQGPDVPVPRGCRRCAPQAPTVGSVIPAAVMTKLGTYGFIRIADRA